MMCNYLRWALVALGLISTSIVAQPGLAQPYVFFAHDNNRDAPTDPHANSDAKYNQFVNSLNSYGMDPVESFGSPFLSFGATGITASVEGALSFPTMGYGLGDYSLVETENLPDPLGTPVGNTIFNLSEPVTAFGLYVTNGGDQTNDNPTTFILRDTVANAEQSVVKQIGPGWADLNVFFLGLRSPGFAFNQVEIVESADIDGWQIDNVVVGSVPEPASLALVVLGGVFALCRSARGRRS